VALALNPKAEVELMMPGVVAMHVATAGHSAGGSPERQDETAKQKSGFDPVMEAATDAHTCAFVATPLSQTPTPAVHARDVQSICAPTMLRLFACPPLIVGPLIVGPSNTPPTICG
jgi:hypothetical protein